MTQVRGNLDIIVTEGERLTALINDLLDLAKMEAGRVEWRDEEVDVDAVVRQVAATVRPSSRRRTCRLDLDLEPELPPVRGDRHRLEQVVINLISNAVQVHRHGRCDGRGRAGTPPRSSCRSPTPGRASPRRTAASCSCGSSRSATP